MYPDEIRSKPIDEREPMNNTEISTEADDITQDEREPMNNTEVSTGDEGTQDEAIVVRPASENYEAMSFDYPNVSILNKFENWLQKRCKLVISDDWTLFVDDSYSQFPVKLGDWVVYDRWSDVISVMSSEEFSRDWVRV